MAHIIEFEIEGLAGRSERYGRKLNRDVNIFFGPNGSGKTSLLKILHSALSMNADAIENVPFSAAQVQIESVKYKTIFTHSIKKEQPKKSQKERLEEVSATTLQPYLNWQVFEQYVTAHAEATPSMAWQISPPLPEKIEGWEHGYLPTSRLYTLRGGRGRYLSATGTSQLSEEQLDSFFAATVSSLWSSYSANVLSVVRQAQEQALANILKAVLPSGKDKPSSTVLDAETAYKRISAFLVRQGSGAVVASPEEFARQYTATPHLQAVASYIDKVEKRIEQATQSRTDLQSLIKQMFSRKDVQFRDTAIEIRSASNEPIELASLSSGEKHLLRLFLEVTMVGPSSIMIDEPEISMHVDWQKILVRSLRQLNPRSQFVLATHSPEIMSDTSDEKIFRL